MQESPRQRPHFPRIIESRRRAQEQSNASAPTSRKAPPVGDSQSDAPPPTRVDEQR